MSVLVTMLISVLIVKRKKGKSIQATWKDSNDFDVVGSDDESNNTIVFITYVVSVYSSCEIVLENPGIDNKGYDLN